MNKTANAIIYIQEELSDARLRCDELKRLMARAFEIINSSQKKDHIYAVAGDIIKAIPEALLALERALEATAMAVNKIDYENIRQILRPEKVDELEVILDDVRMRIPRRIGKLSILDYNQ